MKKSLLVFGFILLCAGASNARCCYGYDCCWDCPPPPPPPHYIHHIGHNPHHLHGRSSVSINVSSRNRYHNRYRTGVGGYYSGRGRVRGSLHISI